MPVTAALPRSSLHLDLLAKNLPGVDHVLYRDDHLREAVERRFPGRSVALGRERRPSRNPLELASTIRANHDYYRQVEQTIRGLAPERLILFLEGEPLERFLTDRFDGPIELWEDGLSHYVDLTGNEWYAVRGAVQAMAGFYPRGALSRRADRRRFLVRDRFERKNLQFETPQMVGGDAVLLIGSPLVEDGIVQRERWCRGLRAAREAIAGDLLYLPHPRESAPSRDAVVAIEGLAIAEKPHGLSAHLDHHGYRGFIAPVSTALLDIGAFSRSAYIPKLFGLARMHRALRDWHANPIALCDTTATLRETAQTWPPD